jgi:hypothetical protein
VSSAFEVRGGNRLKGDIVPQPKSMSRNGLLRMAFGLTVANCSLMLMNEFRLRSVLRYRFPSQRTTNLELVEIVEKEAVKVDLN